MATPLYKIPKADVFLRKFGTTDAYMSLGNVSKAELTVNLTKEELKSSGNIKGTLASEYSDMTMELALTCNDAQYSQMLKYLGATAVSKAAGNDTVSIPANSLAGSTIDLGYTNVSNVVIAGKVLGTDYTVNAAAGTLQLLTDFTASVSVDFDYTAQKGGAVMKDSDGDDTRTFEVMIYSKSLKSKLVVYKAKFDPTTVAFIADKFGEFELKGSVLQDTTKAETSEYGQYAKYLSI